MRWNEPYPTKPLTLARATIRYASYLIRLILVSLAAILATAIYSGLMSNETNIEI